MVALVQRPAPAFKAPTVVDGAFEDISLSDYLGKWYVPPVEARKSGAQEVLYRVVLLFYPMCVFFCALLI